MTERTGTHTRFPEARLYLIMVLVGLAIRLAVIPFVYEEHLEPQAIAHREYGRVAQSLVLGQGFSNSLADTGPSAVMPPVYSLLLGRNFQTLWHTQQDLSPGWPWGSAALCSALNTIPVFAIARRCFGRPGGAVGGMGLGILALRHLLRGGEPLDRVSVSLYCSACCFC